MARWVWPAAAGVVASATGVAINVATDWGANPWAWVVVVLLTALGVVVAMRVQGHRSPEHPARPHPTVHNSVNGTVHGGVVQAGSLGSVTVNSPTTIDQTAIARDGGTVYQAGRDVNPGR
ncbi:hypothetical protein [Saccharothrix xinjiangensis]|uniref:NfeD-like partner-binding protein n=1 Tax=Saccharothrix xinjiangensis TaxID=204798 RepID=A0ABV9XRJ3_9PSEU